MTNKICILFSGIDSLGGSIAVQLVQGFNLKEYGAVQLDQRGKLWYGEFEAKVDRINTLHTPKSFTDLLLWFGSRQIKFRFDRSRLPDSQIDFQIHMIQEDDFIKIPEVKYFNG